MARPSLFHLHTSATATRFAAPRATPRRGYGAGRLSSTTCSPSRLARESAMADTRIKALDFCFPACARVFAEQNEIKVKRRRDRDTDGIFRQAGIDIAERASSLRVRWSSALSLSLSLSASFVRQDAPGWSETVTYGPLVSERAPRRGTRANFSLLQLRNVCPEGRKISRSSS